MRKVVATGIGAVSPLGESFGESWEALKAGISGVGPVTRFDASSLKWRAAGELKGFRPERYLPRKDMRRYDPFVHYAFAASLMACEDAGFAGDGLARAGVVMGSSRGGVVSLERALRGRPSSYLMSGTTVSMAASYVSLRLGMKGHILGISTACSSGSVAVGEAARLIRAGHADAAVAGGSDAPLCALCFRGYGASGALSEDGVSRPFDRRRDGFILSEGAAALVLEERESARARGARIYGEVLGYGTASDAYHQTAPMAEGQSRAMRAALADAGLDPGDVNLISAHATSTPLGDRVEARAIGEVFGPPCPPVSAAKSMTGHMLGASGALEAAFALMCVREGVVPPTINLDDPECGLSHVSTLRSLPLRVALCNSFGFGGVNSVLVLGREAD